jgi:hypothetical protein
MAIKQVPKAKGIPYLSRSLEERTSSLLKEARAQHGKRLAALNPGEIQAFEAEVRRIANSPGDYTLHNAKANAVALEAVRGVGPGKPAQTVEPAARAAASIPVAGKPILPVSSYATRTQPVQSSAPEKEPLKKFPPQDWTAHVESYTSIYTAPAIYHYVAGSKSSLEAARKLAVLAKVESEKEHPRFEPTGQLVDLTIKHLIKYSNDVPGPDKAALRFLGHYLGKIRANAAKPGNFWRQNPINGFDGLLNHLRQY